jgi:peptidoglycan hydrolase FlgJ
MSTALIPPLSALTGAPAAPQRTGATPGRVRDAAEQFEALLIGQMLRSQRESGGGGWLGSEDSAGDCATDFAEQQFAGVLAKSGGLGIAALVGRGLEK